MATTGKRLLSMLPVPLSPAFQGGLRNAQIACNLRKGFLTRLRQLDLFSFEFSCKGLLQLAHALIPFSGEILSLQFTFSFTSDQDQFEMERRESPFL